MLQLEVEINRIEDGGTFKFANHVPGPGGKGWVVTSYTFGIKLYHNTGRARVSLHGGQQHVVFGEGTTRREFESTGRSEVNWAPETMVFRVSREDYDLSTTTGPFRRGNPTGGVMDPKQVKALQAKYQFQTKALAEAEAARDESKVATAKSRLEQIEVQAGEAGVTIATLQEVPAAGVTTVTGKGATTKAPDAGGKKTLKEKNAERVATLAAKKAAKPKPAPKEKKEKALPTTYDCLCGCKTETAGLFAPGHDARVKGQLYKVERGEMEFTDLPAGIQALVKMAGRKATAGKDDSDYRVVQSPVKFPGREEIKLVDREGKPRG